MPLPVDFDQKHAVRLILESYERYNSRDFGFISDITADTICTFVPKRYEKKGELVAPVALARCDHIELLRTKRELFGPMAVQELLCAGSLISTVVKLSDGSLAACTATITGGYQLSRHFFYRKDERPFR